MNTDLLLGTWRTTSIHWHPGNHDTYHDLPSEPWFQFQFGPGGELYQSRNHNGKLHIIPMLTEWKIEKGNIIIYQHKHPADIVIELTEKTLTLEAINTGIKYFFKRVG